MMRCSATGRVQTGHGSPSLEETGVSKTGSRFYAGSGTIPIQNMVLSRTSMSVYGCQTFGLVAQGGVPIRLSAVRTRGSQEAGCRSRGVEFAPDSPLEGDGFELLVPRHKSRGFPQHSGHSGGIGGALKRYHLMVQPFFFCASDHSTEPGWGTV